MSTYEQELSAYHLLKAATSQYGVMPSDLDGEQVIRVNKIADKSLEIESLVLSSDEARNIGPADEEVVRAMEDMAARYDNQAAFVAALSAANLTVDGMKVALRREIWATLVMDSIGARADVVTEDEIKAFFDGNAEKFSVDETRVVRHILVTINDDYEDNTVEAALMRIAEAKAKLEAGQSFAAIAKMYSECPTAMEGGLLGRAPKGKLYPEIDSALFEMEEGEISQPIQTDMGYHLIFCEAILKAEEATLDEARGRIQVYLESKKQQQVQREWLAGLATNSPKETAA